MENPVERVCYTIHPCTATTDIFHDTCLNGYVLPSCIINHADYFGDDVEFTPSNYRKAWYIQYSMYSYGYLGRRNGKVAPACVVLKI